MSLHPGGLVRRNKVRNVVTSRWPCETIASRDGSKVVWMFSKQCTSHSETAKLALHLLITRPEVMMHSTGSNIFVSKSINSIIIPRQ